jgi:hypothetical protein
MGAYYDTFCIVNIVGGVFVNSTFVFSSKKEISRVDATYPGSGPVLGLDLMVS